MYQSRIRDLYLHEYHQSALFGTNHYKYKQYNEYDSLIYSPRKKEKEETIEIISEMLGNVSYIINTTNTDRILHNIYNKN